MSDWTEGYVSDIQYTAGFYREMSPSHLAFVALVLGYSPGSGVSPKNYLELASGQGLGTALMAAAYPQTDFVGIDFNPAQTANARRLACSAGLQNVKFLDLSFQDVLQKGSGLTEDFDIVGLHGIYSWVSAENRSAIVDILNHKLRPGGLAYISYNCMPGWSSMAPAQRLIREFAKRNPNRSDKQIEDAFELLKTVGASDAVYFKANPNVQKTLDRIKGQNKHYLAHEFLNAHWHPLYFADVADELTGARLSFMGSASLLDNMNSVSVPSALRSMIQSSPDPVWTEMLRDFASNKQFRRDVFARGVNKLTPLEHRQLLWGVRFVLTVPVSEVNLTFKGLLGEYQGPQDVYDAILGSLSESTPTFGELTAIPALGKIGPNGILQALCALISSGQLLPIVFEGADFAPAHRFNRAVIGEMRAGRIFNFVVSPVAATGISMTLNDLYVLAAVQSGKTTLDEAVRASFDLMISLEQRPKKEGKAILDDNEAIASVRDIVAPILTNKLPIWRRLGVL